MRRITKMIRNFIVVSLIVTALPLAGKTNKIQEIASPTPTVIEQRNQYAQLVEVGHINEDMGGDQFLLGPSSLAADSKGNLYIYDGLQTRIFKLDKDLKLVTTFGHKGVGPGEFKGSGKNYPVYLKIGPDGNLYCNDYQAHRLVVFKTDGTHVKDIPYLRRHTMKRPIVDARGNILKYTVGKDDILYLTSSTGSPAYTIGHVRDIFFFLFWRPHFLKESSRSGWELSTAARWMFELDTTPSGQIMLFIEPASTLYILKDHKVKKRLKLWPKRALEHYKTRLKDILDKEENGYRSMFFYFFVDEDKNGDFYLQLGRDESQGINNLYQFNGEGQLVRVLYKKITNPDIYTKFMLKNHNRLFALEFDEIKVFKIF